VDRAAASCSRGGRRREQGGSAWLFWRSEGRPFPFGTACDTIILRRPRYSPTSTKNAMIRVASRFRWLGSLVVLCLLVTGLGSARPTHAQDSRLPLAHLGVALAVVVDVNDPEDAGRIKVRFPWVRGDVEAWALVSLPLGGNHTGFWTLPEIGDEVIIGFEHGEVRSPVVLGSLWNGKDRPLK
jgi:type VI secretion system (T6SS) baseplate-like injector VgrG